MKRWAPVASAGMAIAALACCLPLGLAGATGLLALAAILESFQGWFLGGAALLLAVGAVECYRGQKSCRRRGRRFSLAVLAMSAVVVLGVLVFPQHVAGVMADGELIAWRKGPAPPLVPLDGDPAGSLQAQFNQAVGSTRVLLLLAPSCPVCLQGASEMQRVLAGYPGAPISVFAVWDKILPTDWREPGTRVRYRLNDARVRHFWDPNHTVAAELRRAGQTSQMEPGCCEKNGIWWDVLAVFPPGARWEEKLPQPLLLDGTIVDVAPRLAHLLRGSDTAERLEE